MPAELASCQDPKKRYTKYQCIGRGASKVVYKAFDEVEGIEVAWAEVLNLNCSLNGSSNGKERSKMLGEITMLRQLKHRNIMRLYDWWYDKQQQTLVFITELLTDGSLRRFLRRKHATGITLSVLKRYAWQILQALVYLHGHDPPIIHRDLKCDNIFVNGASGELKLGDLGFACLLRGMSAPLSVIGTPEFMAPELYDEHYDEKVDIYSYGMCLLELATMQYPYSECTNPAQIYRKVSQGIPPAGLAQVELPQLREFISLCISHDPGRRPEARQLLNHPFFEDLRAQIKAKGWLRAPAALPAAAAGVLSPAAAAAGAPADGRGPLSAPDGLAALAAAAAAAAADAGSEPVAIAGAGSDAGAGAAAAAGGSGSADVSMARSMPEVAMLHATLLAEQEEQELQELQQQEQQEQQQQLLPQMAAQPPQQELRQQQHHHQQQPAQQHTIQRQEQQPQQQPQQPPQQDNSAFEHQTQHHHHQQQHQQQQQQQQHSHWAPPDAVGTAATAMAAATSSLRRPGSGDTSFFTPNQSPFTSASFGSTASSCGSWGGGSSTTAGASSSVGVPGRGGAKAAGHEAGAGCGPQPGGLGRRASLGEEMSEEDVLFDAHSEGHSDEADQHSDHSDPDAPSSGWHLAGGHHRQQQQQQAGGGAAAAQAKAAALAAGCGGCLDPIAEDGADDEEDETTVDCVCRRIDQQQLSFNVGFFNTKGMRKRVGFQYNAAEDTADDIAVEMLENLSLMPDQAAMIAEKIKAALAALGIGPGGPANGTTQLPPAAAAAGAGAAPPAAAAGSSSSGGGGGGGANGAVTGESAAIAIVATAAASAALESVGTPAGTDLGSSAVSGGGASAASSYGGGGSGSGPAAGGGGGGGGGPQGLDLMGLAAAAGSGGPDATSSTTTSTASPGGGGGVHPQQLVRQLSLLRRDQGEALLHSLQDDLLAQSRAMPQAAAAVGVDIAELAAGQAGGSSPRGGPAPARSAPLPALEPLLEGQQLQLLAGGAGGAAGAVGANWRTP